MGEWTEEDSATFRAIAPIAVPRRQEMIHALVSAVPFARDEAFSVLELGSGEGLLAEAFLERFPNATLRALDGSESMLAETTARTARFGARANVSSFALDTLDWWGYLTGVDLVMSSLCLHHLNDAKKRYVYKAVADRLPSRGAILIGDVIEPVHPSTHRLAADAWDALAKEQAVALAEPDRYERFVGAQWNHFRFPDSSDRPSPLLFHLIWLRHAGFAAVDCMWLVAGHAVFGGFKSAAVAASRERPRAGS